jgi:hypothetical protein
MPSIINATTTSGLVTSADNSGSLQLATNNGTTAVTIDTSQNVGIGTSSPNRALSIQRGSGVGAYIDMAGNGNTLGSSSFVIGQGEDDIAYIYNRKNSVMAFATNNTERMRITSGGAAKMTTTGNYRSTSANFYEMNLSATDELVLEMTNETATRPYGFRSRFSAAAPNNTDQYFYTAVDSSTTCFTIWSNGTTSGRSDERLKKNIEDASPKLDDLCKLQVRNYEWKESDGGSKEIGLIAQEVEQVFPSLVITHNIEKQGDDYKEIKYSVFVPMLIKAVQELKGIVDTQATKIAELEAKLEGTE